MRACPRCGSNWKTRTRLGHRSACVGMTVTAGAWTTPQARLWEPGRGPGTDDPALHRSAHDRGLAPAPRAGGSHLPGRTHPPGRRDSAPGGSSAIAHTTPVLPGFFSWVTVDRPRSAARLASDSTPGPPRGRLALVHITLWTSELPLSRSRTLLDRQKLRCSTRNASGRASPTPTKSHHSRESRPNPGSPAVRPLGRTGTLCTNSSTGHNIYDGSS